MKPERSTPAYMRVVRAQQGQVPHHEALPSLKSPAASAAVCVCPVLARGKLLPSVTADDADASAEVPACRG